MSDIVQICLGFLLPTLDDVTTSYNYPPWQLVCCFLRLRWFVAENSPYLHYLKKIAFSYLGLENLEISVCQVAEGFEACEGSLMDCTLGFEDPLNLPTKLGSNSPLQESVENRPIPHDCP